MIKKKNFLLLHRSAFAQNWSWRNQKKKKNYRYKYVCFLKASIKNWILYEFKISQEKGKFLLNFEKNMVNNFLSYFCSVLFKKIYFIRWKLEHECWNNKFCYLLTVMRGKERERWMCSNTITAHPLVLATGKWKGWWHVNVALSIYI